MTHIIAIDDRQMLSIDGEQNGTHLTRHEEAVLRCIFSHSTCTTKEFMLTALYGGRDEPDMKVMEVYVTKVRAKLGPHRDAITTVWGRGYARNPAYSMQPKSVSQFTVGVDAVLVEKVAFAAGQPPEVVIERLLTAEHQRLYSVDAA